MNIEMHVSCQLIEGTTRASAINDGDVVVMAVLDGAVDGSVPAPLVNRAGANAGVNKKSSMSESGSLRD